MLALQGSGNTTGWTPFHIAQEREGFSLRHSIRIRPQAIIRGFNYVVSLMIAGLDL